jgi:hypothetical protein
MDTVIARSGRHMWTAFRTPAGVAILNVAEPGEPGCGVVSLVIDEDDVDTLLRSGLSAARVDAILRSAPRLQAPLATPPISPYERMAA